MFTTEDCEGHREGQNIRAKIIRTTKIAKKSKIIGHE